MKHETLFTCGDNDQYELVDTKCLGCRCEFSFIDEPGASSLPICLLCEQAIKLAVETVDRKLNLNDEG